MANYILTILQSQIMIVFSWGFNSPKALENGLRFTVQGFKFKGIVRVIYNDGMDLFNVEFIQNEVVVNEIEDIYLDQLVDVIDNAVEKCDDYEQKVKSEYSLL